MPKRKVGRKKNLKGEGFMDFIRGVGNVAKKVGGFLKDTKILSTVGSMVPHAGVQSAARLAGSIGLGRKRKPGPKKGKSQRGGAMNLHGVRSTARPALKL